MEPNEMFRSLDISGSALSAERLRMQIVATNIANAGVTRTEDGGPYRRREVVFAEELARAIGEDGIPRGGVRVAGVVPDPSEFERVYRPSHPDADEEGFVAMPNVNVALEMVDLLNASRSYEANLTSVRAFQEMMRQTLAIGRA